MWLDLTKGTFGETKTLFQARRQVGGMMSSAMCVAYESSLANPAQSCFVSSTTCMVPPDSTGSCCSVDLSVFLAESLAWKLMGEGALHGCSVDST
jgi:hypothetical protein